MHGNVMKVLPFHIVMICYPMQAAQDLYHMENLEKSWSRYEENCVPCE